jgi:catechol 2,3-dioxygenase-like lactoylglutathione lyase family enzyme
MQINAYIVWSAAYDRTVAFYRALGVPLADEQHADGPAHVAGEVGGVHLAIYPADGAAAPGYRTGGAAMLGFAVVSLDAVLAELGAPIVRPPEDMPWGRRVVVADPDGRPVELTETS